MQSYEKVSEIQKKNPFFFLFPNISVFMTVYSVLMACMTASMIQTMVNFMRSMHQPEAQQQLSWRESVLPQVRSMAILLLIAASFVANVLSGVIALLMIRKGASKQL